MLGFPDFAEVLEDGLLVTSALFGREVVWRLNDVVDILQFVEEAALLFSMFLLN